MRVSLQEGIISSQVFTKPTAGHLYLHPDSCHPRNQIDSIPFSQGLRLNRNTSDPTQMASTFSEFEDHFKTRGYDMELVRKQFKRAGTMERSQLLAPKKKQKANVFPLVLPYNPKLPQVSKIIRKKLEKF